MSLILMTTLFYEEVILQGEIWCSSLVGPTIWKQKYASGYKPPLVCIELNWFLRHFEAHCYVACIEMLFKSSYKPTVYKYS